MRMLSRTRATAAAELAGITLGDEDLTRAASLILTAFPTALGFFRSLLTGMVESGVDFSRPQHANSVWDMSLAAVVSPSSSVGGVPTILVTDERKLHTAAAVTPHAAFYSEAAIEELQHKAAGHVAQVLRGETPTNIVNPEAMRQANYRAGPRPGSA